jgi:glycosyltransferase involved in cell wall biosynthesis
MKIGIATTMGDNAPSYHLRFRSVLDALQRDGRVQCHDIIRPVLFGRLRRFSPGDDVDLIFIARIRDLDYLKRIFDFAASKGIPVVYETDDLILYDRKRDMRIEQADEVALYMKRAAGIITSTPHLAEELMPYNARIFIFPNLIDAAIWDIDSGIRIREGRPLKICCAGIGLLPNNLAFIISAMEYCEKNYGRDVIFTLWGNANYIDERVRNLRNVMVVEKMPYRKFARKLQHSAFDLGVVPLSDLRFNRAKSAIKYLEYAVSGIPAVFSRVGPYAELPDGETCLLTDNDSDAWKQAIVRMIENRELRERYARNAFRHVKGTFILNETWAARYAAILGACCGS